MESDSSLARAQDSWNKHIAPDVRAKLVAAGVTRDAIDWIVGDLEPRVLENLIRTPTLTVALPNDAHQQVLHVLTMVCAAALVQLVRLERELYEARFGKSAISAEQLTDWAASNVAAPATVN